jgi:hypothetical protein
VRDTDAQAIVRVTLMEEVMASWVLKSCQFSPLSYTMGYQIDSVESTMILF